MKLSEFVTLLTFETCETSSRSIDRADVSATLKALAVALRETLEQGDSINLPGIGTFKVVERAARTGRNPRTGEQISIPARRQVKFVPGKSLSEALKGDRK